MSTVPTESANQEYIWKMEYYCPSPSLRIFFIVKAKTLEEAIEKGDSATRSLCRINVTRDRPLSPIDIF